MVSHMNDCEGPADWDPRVVGTDGRAGTAGKTGSQPDNCLGLASAGCFCKGPVNKFLGFAGHMVSAAAIPLCQCSIRAGMGTV